MVAIINKLGPLDPQEISVFEKSQGITLPTDYKLFLEEYNGGKPVPNSFDFDDGNDASCIDSFLGLTNKEYYSIQDYMKGYEGRIPEGFIIIAHDPGGNLVLLCVTEGRKGVYFWDHEMEAEDGEIPGFENMHLITESFEGLLLMLYEVEV